MKKPRPGYCEFCNRNDVPLCPSCGSQLPHGYTAGTVPCVPHLPLLREPTTPERETNQAEEEIMKAQIIPYPPPPREVVVTMGEDEAKLLFRTLHSSPLIPGTLLTLHDALYYAGIRE